jgi:hypothetical protein
MSFLNEMYDDSDYMSEDDSDILDESLSILSEANKVVFDKKTLKKRMLRQSELLVAKEQYPNLFAKYAKATKTRKKYRGLIHEQCGTKAQKKLKEFLRRKSSGEGK